ncbi:hypothetical protein BH10PSE6_BH10PSE6_34870 [soil metagenome]
MAKLGPELFERLNADQRVGDRTPVIYGAPGLSSRAFAAIEEQLGFRLPEDFIYLFANLQDPGGVLFSWGNFRKKDYDASIEWVWQGIEFDIRHNSWLDRWGARPHASAEAIEVAKADFATWPKLLPIYGHRFLAAEPCRVGNPVFSIKQMDIVYYGYDLVQYLMLEFVLEGHGAYDHTYFQKIQRVDVWSDFAEDRYRPYR